MEKTRRGTCPTCQKEFVSKSPKKYCSQACFRRSDDFKQIVLRSIGKALESRRANPKRVQLTCAKCGKEFAVMPSRSPEAKNESHRRGKITFCSLQCYRTSPLANQDKKVPLVTAVCQICNVEFSRKPGEMKSLTGLVCSRHCWRVYFAQRYDRFVANPETVNGMQDYDEFLTKEVLPCLFDGCDWQGLHLGIHVNHVHGISVEDFKEMAGFNRTTALMAPESLQRLRESQKDNTSLQDYVAEHGNQCTYENNGTYERRPETLEHLSKVWAEIWAKKRSAE